MCILAATNKIQGITKFRDLLCVSMSLFASHKLGYTSQVVSYIHLCRRSFPTFDGCFPAKCPPPLPWRVRKPPSPTNFIQLSDVPSSLCRAAAQLRGRKAHRCLSLQMSANVCNIADIAVASRSANLVSVGFSGFNAQETSRNSSSTHEN